MGLKLAVTPAGRPETLKVTVPVKPVNPLTVSVDVVLPPAAAVTEVGEAETEKPEVFAAFPETFKLTDAVCVRLPLVAVTVNG